MSENRKLWKCQLLAERIRGLAQSVAMEAAARDSKAYAVVADETWRLADALCDVVERSRFAPDVPETDLDARELADIAEQLELLTVNAAIVALSADGAKGVAICAEEIRRAALDLGVVCGRIVPDLAVQPEPASPSLAGLSTAFFMVLSVGDIRIVENVHFVREIMRHASARPFVEKDRLNLRGRHMPLIDCRSRLGLPAAPEPGESRVVVVNANWKEAGHEEYAAIVDGVAPNAIFKSRFGRTSEPRGDAIPPDFVRECWDASDGSQFLFVDWPRLSA